MSKNKKILDMTCGGRMMWYQPHNAQTELIPESNKDATYESVEKGDE